MRSAGVSPAPLQRNILETDTLTQASDRTIAPTKSNQDRANINAPKDASVLARSSQFTRAHTRRILAISALLLVPCCWHRRIEASDLGSHVYNAWLAQLIRHGQAPGLWIAHQWTNVLFDFLLSFFGSVFGLGGRFHLAEKFAVSLCVLIFFWGAFAFVAAATRRAPWLLTPVIALVAYGYTFRMGFFNYYLAIGLSFFALAIFWRGRGWERLLSLVIAPLVLLAHAIGFIWLIGAAIYIWLAEMMPGRKQFLLLVPSVGALLALHYYFWRHFVVEAAPHSSLWYSGADQLLLYGDRYWICAGALIAFVVIALAIYMVRRREPSVARDFSIPLQLYIVAALAVPLLPRGVHLPHTVPIALLTDRLTSVSAVLICCLLGAMRPSRWHLAASAAIALDLFRVRLSGHGRTQPHGSAGRAPRSHAAAQFARDGDHRAVVGVAHPDPTHDRSRLHRLLLQLRKLRAEHRRLSRALHPRQSLRPQQL